MLSRQSATRIELDVHDLVCGDAISLNKQLLTRSILMFAICQGLLLYCAGWTVYQTVPHTAAGWTDVSGLFNNQTFFDLALSLMVSRSSYFETSADIRRRTVSTLSLHCCTLSRGT